MNQAALATRKNSQQLPADVIPENDQESIATEKKDVNEIDSDEELGRSEEDINLDHVSVVGSSKSNSVKQKAILSP